MSGKDNYNGYSVTQGGIGNIIADPHVNRQTRMSGAAEPNWPAVEYATIVDGGITWTAIYARKTVGTVTGVLNAQVFQHNKLVFPNHFFQYGVLLWLTGRNAGFTTPIRDSFGPVTKDGRPASPTSSRWSSRRTRSTPATRSRRRWAATRPATCASCSTIWTIIAVSRICLPRNARWRRRTFEPGLRARADEVSAGNCMRPEELPADRVRTRREIIMAARAWIGTPYKHQGRGRAGLDCVGLMIEVGDAVGYHVDAPPAYSASRRAGSWSILCEKHLWKPAARTKVIPGDLAVFTGWSPTSRSTSPSSATARTA